MEKPEITELKSLLDEIEKRIEKILQLQNKPGMANSSGVKKAKIITDIINKVTQSDLSYNTYYQTFLNGIQIRRSNHDYKISAEILEILQQFIDQTKDIPTSPKRFNPSKNIESFSPNCPEFPIDRPAFPATELKTIIIDGFARVMIKDESQNPTGTHKDRKSFELLQYLQHLHKEKVEDLMKLGRSALVKHPTISLISSGNEAYSLQKLIKDFGYPNLRVILDQSLENKGIASELNKIGAELFFVDLTNKLSTEDVLNITNNQDGIDVTSHLNSELWQNRYKYYDWLCYEILNQSPDYVFLPVGTGDLYFNLLEIMKIEILRRRLNIDHDRRYFGQVDRLHNCQVMGASTTNHDTKADKLYTKFNSPFETTFLDHIQEYTNKGFCGNKSGIYEYKEDYLIEANKFLKTQKISSEYSASAGLALFFELIEDLQKDKSIYIVNTGKLKINSFTEIHKFKTSKLNERLKQLKSRLNSMKK